MTHIDIIKLKAGEEFDTSSEAFFEDRKRTAILCQKYNSLPEYDDDRIILQKEIFGSVGKNSTILSPMRVEIGKNVTIGDNFFSNVNSVYIDLAEIKIGDRVQFGPNVTITTVNHTLTPERRTYGTAKPIIIEDDVWIGASATILPGVTIGRGAVVAAGAVVTKNVPSMTVVGGVPARVMKHIE